MVVNIPFLIDYLEGLVKNNTNQKKTLMGNCFYKAKVVRNPKSKFYMSKNEFDNGFYNEYCEGPAYLITTDLVLKMFNKSLNTKMIKFEDIYVGVLARSLNSTFVYLNKNYGHSKWQNKIIYLKKENNLNEKYFFYSDNFEKFKDIWNYLAKIFH